MVTNKKPAGKLIKKQKAALGGVLGEMSFELSILHILKMFGRMRKALYLECTSEMSALLSLVRFLSMSSGKHCVRLQYQIRRST